MLSNARNCLSTALANNDMVEIKVPNEVLKFKIKCAGERIEKGTCQNWLEKKKSHGTVSERSERSKTVKNFK